MLSKRVSMLCSEILNNECAYLTTRIFRFFDVHKDTLWPARM